MRGSSHEARDLDSCRALESLAASSDAVGDAANRADFSDGAVERRAGAEPASPQLLRPRRGGVWRHKDPYTGRAQRDHSAIALRQIEAGGLAGLAGAGGPRANRRALLSP